MIVKNFAQYINFVKLCFFLNGCHIDEYPPFRYTFYVIHIKCLNQSYMVKIKTKQPNMHWISSLFINMENMTWSCLEAVFMVTAQPASSTSDLK